MESTIKLTHQGAYVFYISLQQTFDLAEDFR
jgi:hypothetical protein